MMQYANRKDCFHNRIAAILIQAGWNVIDTSFSRGKLLDMIACKPRQHIAFFIEVKTDNAPLTDSEREFIAKHREQCVIIRNIEQAINWVSENSGCHLKGG